MLLQISSRVFLSKSIAAISLHPSQTHLTYNHCPRPACITFTQKPGLYTLQTIQITSGPYSKSANDGADDDNDPECLLCARHCSVLCIYYIFSPLTTLQGRCYSYRHFTDEDTDGNAWEDVGSGSHPRVQILTTASHCFLRTQEQNPKSLAGPGGPPWSDP